MSLQSKINNKSKPFALLNARKIHGKEIFPLKYFKARYLCQYNTLSMLPVLKRKKVFLKTQAVLEKKQQKNLFVVEQRLSHMESDLYKQSVFIDLYI